MKLILVAPLVVALAVMSTGAFLLTPIDVDPIDVAPTDPSTKRGAYLARISGCVACHTDGADGQPLAGGVPLETKFGTFYSPNITPDRNAGIGTWSLTDFTRALKFGVSPDGAPYYPAFPHPFYTSLNDRDIVDLWAALQIVPPDPNPAPAHELGFPFNLRSGLKLWRAFFFEPEELTPNPAKSDAWNRGRLIAELAHCGACHTPRNFAGARVTSQVYTGDPAMLDGGASPPIDPGSLRQAGWTKKDLITALKTGLLPDGDVVGGSMAEVVREGTAYLLPQHLDDLATFLLEERVASMASEPNEVTE